MKWKQGARRPEDDYPHVGRRGYADERRQRRDEDVRNAEITREVAAARKADRAGMDELLKRLGNWGDGRRRPR